ncbi:hypothetical protein D3C81_1916740 [compost metagenome]
MSGPDSDALGIQEGSQIMRMDILQIEGDQPGAFAGCRSVDRQAFHNRKHVHGISRQLFLMLVNVIHPNVFKEINGCSQAHCSCDNRGPAFELPGKLLPGGIV